MTSLVCSDPPKMVCSDPPNMVCSDPFYILEGSLQTKDVIDGPSCTSSGNKPFFTKSSLCQTYQNY